MRSSMLLVVLEADISTSCSVAIHISVVYAPLANADLLFGTALHIRTGGHDIMHK